MAAIPVESRRSVENRAAFSTVGHQHHQWTRLRRCPRYELFVALQPTRSGWRERTRSAPGAHPERSGGPDGRGKRFWLLLSGTRSPGRAAVAGKGDSPGWAKSKPSKHSISSQGTDKAKPVAP